MSVAAATPGLRRRMAAFVYEGVLLFGVLFIAELLLFGLAREYSFTLSTSVHEVYCFVILGAYFSWFWSHGGQTVALKAWHLRIVDRAGNPLTQARAFVRYLVSWIWFLPALIAVHLSGRLQSGAQLFGALLAGVLAYVLVARLQPRRQFLHDLICGTQIVDHRPARS